MKMQESQEEIVNDMYKMYNIFRGFMGTISFMSFISDNGQHVITQAKRNCVWNYIFHCLGWRSSYNFKRKIPWRISQFILKHMCNRLLFIPNKCGFINNSCYENYVFELLFLKDFCCCWWIYVVNYFISWIYGWSSSTREKNVSCLSSVSILSFLIVVRFSSMINLY